MSMNPQQIKNIIEAALFTAGRPLSIDHLLSLFANGEIEERNDVRTILDELAEEYLPRGIELKQVASGYRLQVTQELAPWISKLTEERPVRYSRAFMETLSLIVYRQPITRAEIEDIRGVTVSSSIVKTLMERQWVRIVGHRDVPGKPSLLGTTKQFLDYFNLKSLSELPPLADIKSIDSIQKEFNLEIEDTEPLLEQASKEQLSNEEKSIVLPPDDESSETIPPEQIDKTVPAPQAH